MAQRDASPRSLNPKVCPEAYILQPWCPQVKKYLAPAKMRRHPPQSLNRRPNSGRRCRQARKRSERDDEQIPGPSDPETVDFKDLGED